MNRSTGSTVLHVDDANAGKTLAAVLKHGLGNQSWSKIRNEISARRVQINGNLCTDEGRRVKSGDVVKLLEFSLAPPPDVHDVKIRFLDAHLVIVEKPAGLTTVRHWEERNWSDRRRQRQLTLHEMLPQIIQDFEHQRARPKRPNPRAASKAPQRGPARLHLPIVRPVHRLDRETSGLMAFARTVPAERNLVQQFRKHTVERSYLAIVHGHPAAQTFESIFVRDRGDGRRGSTKLPNTGQRAVTHIRPLERMGEYSLIECRLETGRTHQIRIHLSEAGHFLCGDKVYCQPLFAKPQQDHSGSPRLALHSQEIGLAHPITGEVLHFAMEMPPDLSAFLSQLRARSGPR